MALYKEFETQGNFLFKNRSFLPILVLLPSFAVYIYEIMNGPRWSFLPTPNIEILALGVGLIGVFIRFWAIGYAQDHTSGRNTTEGQIAESINTKGLYSTCRHPLYVGNYFMWLGLVMLTENMWFVGFVTLAYWLYYERIMYAEEMFLIKKYGKSYEDWAEKTPAFIPRLGRYQKPDYTFSLRKIIRQEKAGLLNFFGVLFVFQVIDYLVTEREIEFHWFVLFGASILWYLVIKIIQKTSKVLDPAKDR